MKKKGGILLLISQFIISTVLLPFFASPVYADSFGLSSIEGYDYQLVDYNDVPSSSGTIDSGNYIYRLRITFDDTYLGYINVSATVKYYLPSGSQSTWTKTFTNRYFNGDHVDLYFKITGPRYQATDGVNYPVTQVILTYNHYSGQSFGELQTLEDILSVVNNIDTNVGNIYSDVVDIENDVQTIKTYTIDSYTVLSDTLVQLQNMGRTLTDIDSQLIDVNTELDHISSIRQWNIPFESFSFIHYLMTRNYSFRELIPYNYISTVPVFDVTGNGNMYQILLTSSPSHYAHSATFVLGFSRNINTAAGVIQYFGIDTSIFSVSNFVYLNYIGGYYFSKFDVTNISSDNAQFYLKNASSSSAYCVPVFVSWASRSQYVSTDFALQYGLSNQLLDDLHLIAQGTQQSNSSADNLEDNNDQMASDMDSLATIENGYNQDFNNQLQNIDFSNPIQQNSGLLPAANFVISVFNGLINNNPFSTLIIIVCILLIGKKVIGK